jgi:sarcosine oxidase
VPCAFARRDQTQWAQRAADKALKAMDRCDAAVVGLGAMGAMALWRLAERGVAAAGFDMYEPPHDRGSSHGGSRIIRTAYAEGAFYVPLALRSWRLWEELENVSGRHLLTRCGALTIGSPKSRFVHGALSSAREQHLEHEYLAADEAARRWPQHVLRPQDAVLFEPLAGVLLPEAGVQAALDRARAIGAVVRTNSRVAALTDAIDGVGIELEDGSRVEADWCVLAAGPWLGPLVPELARWLQVERQVNAWFAVDDVELFTPERFPVFIRELDGGRLRFGVPSLDGSSIKVAVHHEGTAANPDSVDRNVSAADCAGAEAFVASMLHGVTAKSLRAIVCMYTNTPDEHLLLGAVPGHPRVIVLGGCSGHSFKFAPLFGEVACDMITGSAIRDDVTPFSPARFTQT